MVAVSFNDLDNICNSNSGYLKYIHQMITIKNYEIQQIALWTEFGSHLPLIWLTEFEGPWNCFCIQGYKMREDKGFKNKNDKFQYGVAPQHFFKILLYMIPASIAVFRNW